MLNKKHLTLSEDLNISPFLVPHRNELSETVGYRIRSSKQAVIYLPDIDSWDDWSEDVLDIIDDNDMLFIDGTFYDKIELKSGKIDKVPHPSIRESMKQFSPLDTIDRKKVNFTHLNHTNNVLRQNSEERNELIKKGFQVAFDGMNFSI